MKDNFVIQGSDIWYIFRQMISLKGREMQEKYFTYELILAANTEPAVNADMIQVDLSSNADANANK